MKELTIQFDDKTAVAILKDGGNIVDAIQVQNQLNEEELCQLAVKELYSKISKIAHKPTVKDTETNEESMSLGDFFQHLYGMDTTSKKEETEEKKSQSQILVGDYAQFNERGQKMFNGLIPNHLYKIRQVNQINGHTYINIDSWGFARTLNISTDCVNIYHTVKRPAKINEYIIVNSLTEVYQVKQVRNGAPCIDLNGRGFLMPLHDTEYVVLEGFKGV